MFKNIHFLLFTKNCYAFGNLLLFATHIQENIIVYHFLCLLCWLLKRFLSVQALVFIFSKGLPLPSVALMC